MVLLKSFNIVGNFIYCFWIYTRKLWWRWSDETKYIWYLLKWKALFWHRFRVRVAVGFRVSAYWFVHSIENLKLKHLYSWSNVSMVWMDGQSGFAFDCQVKGILRQRNILVTSFSKNSSLYFKYIIFNSLGFF